MAYSQRAAGIIAVLADRPIAYHPKLAQVIGVKETVFVCQLLYWLNKGKLADGWIWKTQEEWTEETGLRRTELATVVKHLKSWHILETKLAGVPATTHYRLSIDALSDTIDRAYPSDQIAEILQTGEQPLSLQKPRNLVRSKSTDKLAVYRQTIQENTTRLPETTLAAAPQNPDPTLAHAETDGEKAGGESGDGDRPAAETGGDPGGESGDSWLAESRATGESVILKPGGLAGLTDEEKAAIAGPAAPAPPTPEPARRAENAGAPHWQAILRKAAPKRFVYEHGFTEADVIDVIDRFSQLSGINPPLTEVEARRWHSGATAILYSAWAQFQNARLAKRELMRAILWCIDLFFLPEGPLAFVTATSPHSLTSSTGKLAADLKAIQSALNCGQRLPTEAEIKEHYAKTQNQTKKGRTIVSIQGKQYTDEEKAKVAALLNAPTTGQNPLIAARDQREAERKAAGG